MERETRKFMSVENLKLLIEVLSSFMQSKYGIDLSLTNLDLKRTFYDAMTQTNENPQLVRQGVKAMNQQTLKVVKNLVLRSLQLASPPQTPAVPVPPPPISTAPQSDTLTRDALLYGTQRKLNSTHILPSLETTKQDQSELLKVLESQRNDRGLNENGQAVTKSTPNFAEINKPIEDKPINSKEFQSMLDMMSKNRDAITVPPPPPNSELEKFTQEPNPLGRNQLIADVISTQRETVDPKMFFQMQQEEQQRQLEENNSVGVEKFVAPKAESILSQPMSIEGTGLGDSRLGIVAQPTAQKSTVLIDRYILINSIDRDWTSQLRRYEYKVKFSQTTQEVSKVPIYRNNPTVPYTATMNSAGIPNTSGWYDSSNNFYPAYDPNSTDPNARDIVGYEEITFAADTDANIQTNFKNIHSVAVTRVIVPLDIVSTAQSLSSCCNKSSYNHNFNLSFPYVLLQIDEFKDVYEGTDDTIRKSFCQLVFENSFCSPNGRGYAVLCPAQYEKKVFSPTALSSLPSLTLRLIKPNGELFNNSRDGNRIYKVCYIQSRPHALLVMTSKFFDKNEFYVGDTVAFRNYTLYKVRNEQDNNLIAQFNSFFNRKSGHDVIEIGNANDNAFYRSFYIRAPGSFNEDTGAYVVDTQLIDQLQKFNDEVEEILDETVQNGFILNMSLQNSVSLKITQKIYDASEFASMNV
jgi:hypothetical protein